MKKEAGKIENCLGGKEVAQELSFILLNIHVFEKQREFLVMPNTILA